MAHRSPAPKDAQIIGEVNAIKDYAEIKKMTYRGSKGCRTL